MNLKILHGDIFDSPCRFLVNPVNCDGIMGKGLALEFKNKYPEIFVPYIKECAKKENPLRVMSDNPFQICDTESEKFVINFATKMHWRDPSKIEYIRHGLDLLVTKAIPAYGIDSIAFPALGCGCGGLLWMDVVKPTMVSYLSKLSIPVEIYLGNQNIRNYHRTTW